MKHNSSFSKFTYYVQVHTSVKMMLQNKMFLCVVACSVVLLGFCWTATFDKDKHFRRLLPYVEDNDAKIVSLRGTYESEAWPVGNYEFPKSTVAKGYGRVLLYITSHFSEQHELYLKYCWKNLLSRSPLLQEADVAVYLNPNDAIRREPAMELLRDVFEGNDLKVYVKSGSQPEPQPGAPRGGVTRLKKQLANFQKQSGAVAAMREAIKDGYFEGYDWIIRVNPDVLIRDDEWFRRSMVNPELFALLINCNGPKDTKHLVHTDFFAVRPEVFHLEDVMRNFTRPNTSAEHIFTTWIKDTLLDQKHAWVPNADPASHHFCRAGQGREYFDTAVVHEHRLHPDICTVPNTDEVKVEKIFEEPWPESWKILNA